jgi:hypothetical protein
VWSSGVMHKSSRMCRCRCRMQTEMQMQAAKLDSKKSVRDRTMCTRMGNDPMHERYNGPWCMCFLAWPAHLGPPIRSPDQPTTLGLGSILYPLAYSEGASCSPADEQIGRLAASEVRRVSLNPESGMYHSALLSRAAPASASELASCSMCKRIRVAVSSTHPRLPYPACPASVVSTTWSH